MHFCSQLLTFAHYCWLLLTIAHKSSFLFTFAHFCSLLLTIAHFYKLCCSVLTNFCSIVQCCSVLYLTLYLKYFYLQSQFLQKIQAIKMNPLLIKQKKKKNSLKTLMDCRKKYCCYWKKNQCHKRTREKEEKAQNRITFKRTIHTIEDWFTEISLSHRELCWVKNFKYVCVGWKVYEALHFYFHFCFFKTLSFIFIIFIWMNEWKEFSTLDE